MILDCKHIADSEKYILSKLIDSNNPPKLVCVQVGEDSGFESYLRGIKKDCEEVGIVFESIELQSTCGTSDVINKIQEINNSNASGILLQSPLPSHIDSAKVCCSLSTIKDIDCLNPNSYALPCTPQAILNLIFRVYSKVDGKDIVIINRSDTIGKPLALELIKRNATVTVCHSHTKDIYKYTKNADIIISATGTKHLICADNIKNDALVIDVGVCVYNGKMYGDVDYIDCNKKALLVTPTPNGVGLLTRVELLKRLVGDINY